MTMRKNRLSTGMRRSRPVALPAIVLVALALSGCGSGGADAAEGMQQAREQRAAGELRAASIELKNILQSDPEHADARLLLGQVYVEMGTGDAAEKELSRAADLGKPEAAVAYWLARAMQQQGENQRLLEEIEADAGWPDATRARVAAVRARAHVALGDAEAARQELERAESLGADELETRLAGVRLALATERLERARELAAGATEAFPQSARAWQLRARAAMIADDPEAADEHLTRAIENAFAPHVEHLMRAQVRLTQGRYDAAREDVEWLSEQAPENPRVRFAQGLLAWATGAHDEACTHFGEAVAQAPEMRDIRYYAGVCHYRAGAYNQAETHLREAYQGRAVPGVARVLGATYIAQQRYDRAREVIRPVLQSNPEDTGALALMAQLETATGNSSRAIEYLRRLAELRPDDPSVRLQLGVGLFRAGEVDAGEGALGEALTLEPGFDQAGALLVMSQIRQERYDEALATARSLAEEQPEAPLPKSLEGLVHLARDDRDSARTAFEAALEMDGSDPGARHALARMAIQDEDLDAARGHFEAVLEAYPAHTETLTTLAVFEARTGHPERVGSLLERAHESDPGALRPRLLLARFRLDRNQPSDALAVLQGEDGSIPDNAEALVLASQARIAAGQGMQATQTIERLRELQPESTVPYVLLARAYQSMGRSEDATAQMDRILELDPEHPLALVVKARMGLGEGNLEEARGYLDRVPEDARQHPAYLSARARLAFQGGEHETARDFYRRAYEQAPSGETVTRLAAVERALGDAGRAEELLREWVADHPADTDAQQALGDLYIGGGRNTEAATAYKAVLEQNPGSVVALNNLGWILREEAPAEALGYAEHAATLQPEDPRVLDTLGVVLLENGEPERAVRRLREAVSLAPQAGVLRFHLARALAATGQQDEARSELETALSGDAEFSGVERARALLDELNAGQ